MTLTFMNCVDKNGENIKILFFTAQGPDVGKQIFSQFFMLLNIMTYSLKLRLILHHLPTPKADLRICKHSLGTRLEFPVLFSHDCFASYYYKIILKNPGYLL